MSDAAQGVPLRNASELVPLLYEDLRRVARRERRDFKLGETLRTTALIHEAYFKLSRLPGWQDRRLFLRSAATAMRQILLDAARARIADKRGAGASPLTLDAAIGFAEQRDEALIALDDALLELGKLDARLADVVECRYFAGYTEPETAEVLGIAERTVRRDWARARAWLRQMLDATGDPDRVKER